jgi:hypothetical protein
MRYLVAVLVVVLTGCTTTIVDTRPPEVAAATQTARASVPLLPTITPSVAPPCVVKGNVTSKGEKIYHTTASPNYNQVVIDWEHGEQCFDTAEEAEAAGWRGVR